MYVKAFFTHHLLDYFRETRYDINNFDLIFKKFLEEKVMLEIKLTSGEIISFQKEVESIFKLFKKNKNQLLADLEGYYDSL